MIANSCEFFVAAPEDLPRLLFPNDIQRRPHLAAKDILPDAIGLLDFILTANPDRDPQLVYEAGEVFVYELADEFCTVLAKFPADGLAKLASEWEGADKNFLADLRGLARMSRTLRQRVYVAMNAQVVRTQRRMLVPPPCASPFPA